MQAFQFGAVRVYLNHIAPALFSRMPGWLWPVLDTPALRSFAARLPEQQPPLRQFG